MAESKRYSMTEVWDRIADTLPSKGQCLITLDEQIYLLSVSVSVGEKESCKIWVQGRGAIKVGECGPIGEYNQLIYWAGVIGDSPTVMLDERHGYQDDIKPGEEIQFLGRLLTEGEQDWFDEDKQDWEEWIGA